MECGLTKPASLRLDVEGPDHLAPLVGLFGDELTEVGGRACKQYAAHFSQPRLDLRVSKLIALLSFSMNSVGVFLGAPRPSHALASYLATTSQPVGISGRASKRVVSVTASGRSLPALIY